MQMVHLKTLRSLGHRTSDPHVMQFPVAKSLLPAGPPRVCVLVVGRGGGGRTASSSTKPRSGGSPPTELCLFFFLPLKSEGKGWLIERECCGRRDLRRECSAWKSASESLESAWALEMSKRLPRDGDSVADVFRAEW